MGILNGNLWASLKGSRLEIHKKALAGKGLVLPYAASIPNPFSPPSAPSRRPLSPFCPSNLWAKELSDS